MKKHDLKSLIYQLASPVGLILLGLVLLVSPDTASALIARILGWCILLVGVGFVISAIVDRSGTAGKVLGALVCLGIGGWIVGDPLRLAAGIGRFIGILLLIRGGRDFFLSNLREGKVLSAVVAVLGLILVVLPMTTSRLVFRICGLVLLVVGIAMLVERLKERRYLEKGDPNIIDAL